MSKPKHLSLAPLVFFAALLGAQSGDEPRLLRLDLPVGTVFNGEMSIVQNMAMDMGPTGEMDMVNNQMIEVSQTVVGKSENGDNQTSYEMSRIAMDMQMGETSLMAFDTADETPLPQEMEMIGAMIGKPFQITLSARGELVALEGMDELWESMIPEEPQAKAMFDQIRQMMGSDSQRQMMQMYAAVFPEEPVENGDSWINEMSMANPAFGEFAFSAEYEYQGIESIDGCECVRLALEFAGELDFSSDMLEGMMSQMGAEVTFDIDADPMTGTGVLWLFPETGFTKRSEMAFDFGMRMNFSASDQPSQNIAMSLNQELVVEFTPVTQ